MDRVYTAELHFNFESVAGGETADCVIVSWANGVIS